MIIRYFTILSLVLSCLACQNSEQTASEAEQATRSTNLRPWKLICLGGSTTIGENLPVEQAYPAILQTILEQQSGHDIKIVNAGISGETLVGAETRLSWILQQRLDAFLFALGEAPADQQLSSAESQAVWQSMLTTLRHAYPDIPVYILQLPTYNIPGKAWAELLTTHKVQVLRPNWEGILQQKDFDGKLEAEEQRALADWLAVELASLPNSYYEQKRSR